MNYLIGFTAALLGFGTAGGAWADPVAVDFGSAASFAVLAGSTVTSTGAATVEGDLGVWPGTAITGFPQSVVSDGSIYSADTVAMRAQSDLTRAYNFAAGEQSGRNLTGQNLGGLTLTPGVYDFSSAAQLTGTLTLDAQGNPNALFIFQIGSELTTASNAVVRFIGGGQGSDVVWQVGSSATLGTDTAFAGSILALTSVTLDNGATLACGRALARNGAVTLDSNDVSLHTAGCAEAAIAEPGSVLLLGSGLMGLVVCAGAAATGMRCWPGNRSRT